MTSPLDYQMLDELLKKGKPLALCTVVAIKGSTPRKLGAKMVVLENDTPHGSIYGTIGGGAIEHRVRTKALQTLKQKQATLYDVALANELGMCCGGQMTIFIEPLEIKPHLIIFGAGHIGQALCQLGLSMGFQVSVADPREELFEAPEFTSAINRFDDYTKYDLEHMPFSPDTFAVVVTHDHKVDQELIEKILPKDFRFLALVGSRRKARLTVQRCLNKGFKAAQINQIACPAGLDIAAETPEEIALSIMAQITQIRRSNIATDLQSEIQIALRDTQQGSVA